MSGHSKWANIRIRKGAQDAKRNKIYTRHARLIEMAARAGADPKTNSSLRTAIENAKAESVPNDNIERAIKKGSGELKGEAMQEVLYAAYLPLRSSDLSREVRGTKWEGAEGGGPGGIACLIECLTDNRNRTTANLKLIISKHGGNFADTGSVLWMFERRGIVTVENGKWKMENEQDVLELELIDLGAEDVGMDDQMVRVIASVSDWGKVRDFLKSKGFEILSAGLSYIPKQMTEISDPALQEKLEKFVEAVEEGDDVSEVYTNAEISA